MTTRATGPFDVKIAPLDPAFKTEDNSLGPISIDKQYPGDLDATGKGEMLTGGTAIKVSGVYVAIERVAGTLHGRIGTFLLQHSGVMTRGTPHLSHHHRWQTLLRLLLLPPRRKIVPPVFEDFVFWQSVFPTGAPRLLRREVEGSWHD